MEMTKNIELDLSHIPEKELEAFGNNILSLINMSGTDMNRSTHYTSKDDIDAVRSKTHKLVFDTDRTIYGSIFCLPGTSDFSKQKAITALLGQPRNNGIISAFDTQFENQVIEHLINNLQANRMLNCFLGMTNYIRYNRDKKVILEGQKINNARTRRMILTALFNSPNFELWSVKYREKLRVILTHIWGEKVTGIIRNILVKKTRPTISSDDYSVLEKYIHRYVNDNPHKIDHCIAFILGKRKYLVLPLHKAFQKAKKNLDEGKILPMEVLEGLASTFHRNTTKAELLKLTEKTMTEKQKKNVQKTAKKAGITIDFDPLKHNMVDLYIYAFEMGITKDITNALKTKAKKAAKTLPFHYEKLGILLDDSFSMSGSADQKLRPMAVACATRDMLYFAADNISLYNANSEEGACFELVSPKGDTNLAEGLIRLLKDEPDAIFVISDGYENAPAGRFNEVLSLARKIGCPTSIYHINPVIAAESKDNIRSLAQSVSVMPVNNPEQIALTLFKAMLETDPKRGISALMASVIPLLEGGK